MSRPKKFVGNKKDGFINFRISAEMSNQINCLCFLLEKSGSEIAVLAFTEFIAKYQQQVDSLVQAKAALQPKEVTDNEPMEQTETQTAGTGRQHNGGD